MYTRGQRLRFDTHFFVSLRLLIFTSLQRILMKLHRIATYARGGAFSIFKRKKKNTYEQLLTLRDIGKKAHLHTYNNYFKQAELRLYLCYPYKNCYFSYQHIKRLPSRV